MPSLTLSPLFLHPSDLAAQTVVRLPLPIVQGNRDYREREVLLLRMDEILRLSGVEAEFLAQEIRAKHERMQTAGGPLADRQRDRVHQYAKQTLRCTIARILSNESHRSFTCHLAESSLLQWFCGIDMQGIIRVPSKSTLQRMESEVPTEIIETLQRLLLTRSAAVTAEGASCLGLADPVDLSMIWMDCTCAKLDIHYPADWVLLRDATRTIMRAIMVIRKHGLSHRMPAPKSFIAAMNQQAMDMSGASRRGRGGDKKRARKRVLRAMKRIVKKVRQHGRRYRDLLEKSWAETDLSQAQAQQIIDRIDGVLQALPAAIKQAHERIIGERIVANDDKKLSLYEPHAQVYVRGKAGADVEFGLQLLLSESAEGLIVDCHLVNNDVVNDTTLLMPAIARIQEAFGQSSAGTVVTDRGFASAANDAALEELGIINSTLPRKPDEMKKLLADPTHQRLHRRRAQTEARIGIFKANFLGDHLPTKGFERQQRFVAWAALAHNLWVLARLEIAATTTAQAS